MQPSILDQRGVSTAAGCIAPSREQAMRKAAPRYEQNIKMFGELRLAQARIDE